MGSLMLQSIKLTFNVNVIYLLVAFYADFTSIAFSEGFSAEIVRF